MSFALIRTATDHQKCLRRLEKLMAVQEDSADDIGVLSLIIQDWESRTAYRLAVACFRNPGWLAPVDG
jgi:hypothetical protein